MISRNKNINRKGTENGQQVAVPYHICFLFNEKREKTVYLNFVITNDNDDSDKNISSLLQLHEQTTKKKQFIQGKIAFNRFMNTYQGLHFKFFNLKLFILSVSGSGSYSQVVSSSGSDPFSKSGTGCLKWTRPDLHPCCWTPPPM